MDKHKKISIAFLLIVVVGLWALLDCGLDKSEAEQIIVQELQRRGFDRKYLSDITNSGMGDCTFVAEYKSPIDHISYVVSPDWLHGIELHQWDYNKKD